MSLNGYRVPSDYKNDASKYTHGWKAPAYFTMHPGLAYVTHHRHLNAGDRVRGNISQLVQSQPMVGPLMQGFRMITIATFTPDSIIYGWMRNGVRYTPQEWVKFDKWYFNPVSPSGTTDDSIVSAVDPSVSADDPLSKVYSFMLSPLDGDTSVKRYDLWSRQVWTIDSDRNISVGRGGLYDCLGIAPGASPCGFSNAGVLKSYDFSLAPIVAYFLSSYYYLANMQEPYMYYSRGAFSLTYNGSGVEPHQILDPVIGYRGSLSQLGFHQALVGFDPDDFISLISSLGGSTLKGNPSNIADMNVLASRAPFINFSSFQTWLTMGAQAHGGLFAVPYRPDFFNNIIKVGDSPSVQIPVIEGTEEGGTSYSVAIPDLRFYNKVQNMMDRIFVGFGRFGDQLRTLMGVNSSPYINKPDFLGIWQASLNPVNTVAMAAGTNEDKESSSPGQMTARIDDATGFGGRSIDYYAKEAGTVMFISFLVPMPAYSQGLHPDLATTSFADDFNPELKGSGFQNVPRWRYSILPSSFDVAVPAVDPNLSVVGDTVAFDWLKTDYSRLHGEFATNGSFEYWTLDRRFTEFWQKVNQEGIISDVTVGEYTGTYINPLSWQYVFQAQTVLDPNFFVGMNFDLKVTSSVPTHYMPYMGR